MACFSDFLPVSVDEFSQRLNKLPATIALI